MARLWREARALLEKKGHPLPAGRRPFGPPPGKHGRSFNEDDQVRMVRAYGHLTQKDRAPLLEKEGVSEKSFAKWKAELDAEIKELEEIEARMQAKPKNIPRSSFDMDWSEWQAYQKKGDP